MGALHEKALLPPVVHQPRTLYEAWELKSALGDSAVYVSGGTLLRTQWEAGTSSMPGQLIDLRQIAGFDEISLTESQLVLGALSSLSQCRKDKLLRAAAPAVQEAVRCIAAPAVRNLATLGGNIASGFGDILPALLVYDAELVCFDGKWMVSQPITEWLAERWGGAQPAADLVAEIRITLPLVKHRESGRVDFFRKIGRREAFTPSLVTVAMTADIDEGRRISSVRIAAGGGSGRPQRLSAVESLLEGRICKEDVFAVVYEAVVDNFETYSDLFGTASYKKRTAGNLIVSELWKCRNNSAG